MSGGIETTISANERENITSFLLQTTKGLNHLHISGGFQPKEDDILKYIKNFDTLNENSFLDYVYIVKDINLLMFDGSVPFLFEEIFDDKNKGKLKSSANIVDFFNSKRFITKYYSKIIVILLRNAEYLTEFNSLFLKNFFEIPQCTEILIKFITVSKLPWHVISTKVGIRPSTMEIVLSPLDRAETEWYLLNSLCNFFEDKENSAFYYKRSELEKYVDVFLQATYTFCRDINALLFLAKKCLEKLTNRNIGISGSKAKELQDINVIIFDVLSSYYMGKQNNSEISKNINLPVIVRYAIVAAYCASFNPPSSDKRFFVKQHIKQRKTMYDVKKDPKNSLHELGPKSFSVDRFKMIFSFLLSKQDVIDPLSVGTADILENLCNLGMLGRSTKQTNFDFPKYRSILPMEFVEKVGDSIDITLKNFLCDFASL
ncbi:Origin recognition complex subunit 5 [Strongyloides ratti]|uniref:Origin recognition complex subunit 5 n=1 Tax=Strongyloides ratti TaxID=34506 RepID=A0A090LFF7_STRRB|nr:Origin recognition complex subunit 5 [Strongyloides ratti]CEF66883.1 Origin recognition complex subunit 5 [Strongyloides ratti]